MRSIRGITLTLALLLAAPALLGAQSYAIDRGSLLVGGSAGFTSSGSDGDDSRLSQLLVNPQIQYFVTRGLAFGGEITVHRTSFDDSSGTYYGGGPSMMYFFGGDERPVYPYLSANLQLLRSGDENVFGYRAAGGAIVMLVDAVGVNGSLYYQAMEDDISSSDTYGLALGIAAFVF